MSLADKFKQAGVPAPKKRITTPVWKGPEEDGITFSLLSRFLVCRERFRLLVVEGLRSKDRFNHRLEFGTMWHVCEEHHAKDEGRWLIELTEFCKGLCRRYPMDQQEIDRWYQTCKLMFPIYVKHWRRHPDVVKRTPVMSERVFCVPYTLPSGRVVKLRGKWDSVDQVGNGRNARLWLQENKTKGDVDEQQVVRQLSFDLQTMIYLTALIEADLEEVPPLPLAGVRYNVIKRPRHYQGKKETEEGFYKRLQGVVDTDPQDFFFRWNAEVTADDVKLFRLQCLDPILEQLCDWWEFMKLVAQGCDLWGSNNCGVHFRYPFGVYNVLNEGGVSELDEYLRSGSTAALERSDDLFPELK